MSIIKSFLSRFRTPPAKNEPASKNYDHLSVYSVRALLDRIPDHPIVEHSIKKLESSQKLSPQEQYSVAFGGEDHHKDKLVLDRTLDDHAKTEILAGGKWQHGGSYHLMTQILLHHSLNDKHKYSIAAMGTNYHRSTLLKKDPTHAAKAMIAMRGTDRHRHELLDHHELDDDTKFNIASKGNFEHIQKLIDHHDLDEVTKGMIEKRGFKVP
jgi:hypothetical protein